VAIIEEDIQSLEDGLIKSGLKSEDVDTVILAPPHPAHVRLASKFTKARIENVRVIDGSVI
jgi:hypothetical protein